MIRDWGYWEVLNEGPKYKVKKLVIQPGKSLSNQKHYKRAETWILVSGVCYVENEYGTSNKLIPFKPFHIPVQSWHRAYNKDNTPAEIIEIWDGESTENDIERR
jgi:mannose-6-phosphate isomerase-like protein (cupin superfamily)|tara:strand:- start:2336 stop:2647 length:312 start_codon:yes stop_codon:yes gene_type:complete